MNFDDSLQIDNAVLARHLRASVGLPNTIPFLTTRVGFGKEITTKHHVLNWRDDRLTGGRRERSWRHS